MAVGSYTSQDGKRRPLLAITKDSGVTWTFPTAVTTPNINPAFSKNGNLNNVYYYGGTWFILGSYNDGRLDTQGLPAERLLFAKSTNSGASWVYPATMLHPLTTPAFNNKKSEVTGISCSGRTCIATGYYEDTKGIFRPLLALSTNLGSTWTFPKAASNPTTSPAFLKYGGYYKVSCYTKNCVAVGFYTDTSNKMRPLMIVTNDLGKTWHFPAAISQLQGLTVIPSTTTLLALSGVACRGISCIATGFSEPKTGFKKPLLAVSKDYGKTWVYNKSIFKSNVGRSLYTPIYQGKTCMILGSETTPTSSKPLIGITQNNGDTWVYPTQVQQPTLHPPFVSYGTFTQFGDW